MTTPEAIDLAALRRAAKAAIGPEERIARARGCGEREDLDALLRFKNSVGYPSTILALLDRLDAAEAVVEAARAVYDEDDVWCDDDGDGQIGVRDKALGSALSNFDRAIAGQQQREGTTDAV